MSLPLVSLLVVCPLSPAPGVWLMYAQFAVQEMDKFEEGVAFPREVFERAITASGLHASKVRGSHTMTPDFTTTVTGLQPLASVSTQLFERCVRLSSSVTGVTAVGCLSRV